MNAVDIIMITRYIFSRTHSKLLQIDNSKQVRKLIFYCHCIYDPFDVCA